MSLEYGSSQEDLKVSVASQSRQAVKSGFSKKPSPKKRKSGQEERKTFDIHSDIGKSFKDIDLSTDIYTRHSPKGQCKPNCRHGMLKLSDK